MLTWKQASTIREASSSLWAGASSNGQMAGIHYVVSSDRKLLSEFRSGIGSLQWIAGTTRPDLAADVSLLQKDRDELKIEDLHEVAKATADTSISIEPVPADKLILVAYGDSAFANAPGGKSQGGMVVLVTEAGSQGVLSRLATAVSQSPT